MGKKDYIDKLGIMIIYMDVLYLVNYQKVQIFIGGVWDVNIFEEGGGGMNYDQLFYIFMGGY